MKINDKLYRTTSPSKLFEYTVTGIIDRGNGKMFEIKCEQCLDHKPCYVLVQKENNNTYTYCEMKNNIESEYYWHNDGFYRLTEKEALKDMYVRFIEHSEKEIEKNQSNIEYHKKQISNLLSLIHQ